MALPHNSGADLHAWGNGLVAEAERIDDPYVVNLAVKQRLAELPADATEREAIEELLIEWLSSPDLNRWHPALMVLLDEGVRRAAPAVREASAAATTEKKQSFATVFDRVAQELENPVVLDDDPAVRRRWEAFESTLLAVAKKLPGLGDEGAGEIAVANFVDDGDYVHALLFAASDITASDERPIARELATMLVPEFELMLEDDDEAVTAAEREALARALERLNSVVA